MTAKEFLETKGIFMLDTKKRFNEVLNWMEEFKLTEAGANPNVGPQVIPKIGGEKYNEGYRDGLKYVVGYCNKRIEQYNGIYKGNEYNQLKAAQKYIDVRDDLLARLQNESDFSE